MRRTICICWTNLIRYDDLGDRVHWSRAHAEVVRWLEQVEIKHFELYRAHKSFVYASNSWAKVATTVSDGGRKSFARKMAVTYEALARESRTAFRRCSEPTLAGDADLTTITHAELLSRSIEHRKRVYEELSMAS